MIIKKFQGKTEEEAVETAKKVLGANVVVMNVKNIKKKSGFPDFFCIQTLAFGKYLTNFVNKGNPSVLNVRDFINVFIRLWQKRKQQKRR